MLRRDILERQGESLSERRRNLSNLHEKGNGTVTRHSPFQRSGFWRGADVGRGYSVGLRVGVAVGVRVGDGPPPFGCPKNRAAIADSCHAIENVVGRAGVGARHDVPAPARKTKRRVLLFRRFEAQIVTPEV